MDYYELLVASEPNNDVRLKKKQIGKFLEVVCHPSIVDSQQPTRFCDSPRGVDGLNVRKVKRVSSSSWAECSLDSIESLKLQQFRQRPVLEATHLVQEIEAKEKDIEIKPTVELVSEIMDFYRQAIERFEEADDIRHEQVVSAMRSFLSKPVIARILNYDSQTRRSSDWKAEAPVPEGEIIIPTKDQLDADGDDDSVTMMDYDDSFETAMNSFLHDAERAFDQFQRVLESDSLDNVNIDIPALTSLPLPSPKELFP